MRKFLVSGSTMLLLAMLLLISAAVAAEKKAIEDVDSDQFTTDTQTSPRGAGDNHIALVWWIPNEFWESILARDTTTAAADKQAMLDAMEGVSLLAVVQADIGDVGQFDFYTKDEIAKQLTFSRTNAAGETVELAQVESIKPELGVVLGVFQPILGAAMGNLGNNFHFYVLNDSADDATRLLDPYEQQVINIELAKRDGQRMKAEIATPLNSLFVPRLCPNGKEAHVSWEFCPWSGEKLPE
jgi:hypothetical protein